MWFLAEPEEAARIAQLAFMECASGASEEWLRDTMYVGALSQLGQEHSQLAKVPGDLELLWPAVEQIYTLQTEELEKRIERHHKSPPDSSP